MLLPSLAFKMLFITIQISVTAYSSQAKYNGSCSSCIERGKNSSHALCKLQVGLGRCLQLLSFLAFQELFHWTDL